MTLPEIIAALETVVGESVERTLDRPPAAGETVAAFALTAPEPEPEPAIEDFVCGAPNEEDTL
jgi:hypothetical protein